MYVRGRSSKTHSVHIVTYNMTLGCIIIRVCDWCLQGVYVAPTSEAAVGL